MPFIHFFEEGIPYKLKQKKYIRQWLLESAAAEFFKTGTLSYIFCSDDYLLQINRQYLNHDTYTDIITFNNSEKDGVIAGDIFISIERIRENAQKFNRPENEELQRVMIHGLLHLAGYKDKTPADKKEMILKENYYLSKRNFIG